VRADGRYHNECAPFVRGMLSQDEPLHCAATSCQFAK
jgi:hypothetical protein